jgi:uracil-DNA glycosylase
MKFTVDTVLDDKFINRGWMTVFNEQRGTLETILEKVETDRSELKKLNKHVFPFPKKVLRAFHFFSPEETRIVLIAQDPYINFIKVNDQIIPQAMGLSFSVPKEFKLLPPSLKNIYTELESNFDNFKKPNHGNLKQWAKREKMLLLNSALTVQEGKSNSHKHLWKGFTDDVIKYISKTCNGVVFILLGNPAKDKMKLIDTEKHYIFTGVHPSPLSASKGFFGSDIFKKINEFLDDKGLDTIDWNL